VQLTVRVEQSEYVIRCPDGAQHRVEVGRNYVVVPSPFEVDEPDELLWLSDAVLIERARAGAWGLFLVSETALKEEDACQARHRQPVAILNGHKQVDHVRPKGATTAAGTRRAREIPGSPAPHSRQRELA
jgi:hypothetical protein